MPLQGKFVAPCERTPIRRDARRRAGRATPRAMSTRDETPHRAGPLTYSVPNHCRTLANLTAELQNLIQFYIVNFQVIL